MIVFLLISNPTVRPIKPKKNKKKLVLKTYTFNQSILIRFYSLTTVFIVFI